MAPPRLLRAALGPVILGPLVCVVPLAVTARAGTPDPRATVLENVAVHAGAGAESQVVGQLHEGEVVGLDIELNGDEGRWCGVIQEGMTRSIGYVPCGSLERLAQAGGTWRYAGSETRAQPEPAPRASADAQRREKRPYKDVRVLLYYASWCPKCRQARALLQSLGVSVTEYDIDRDPSKKAEMQAKSGQTGIPVLDIEGIQIVGFGEESIRKAVEKRRAAAD